MTLRLHPAILAIPIVMLGFGDRPAPPRPTRAEPVVTVAWLKQHINDPNLVLLHVGERSEYDAGHIRGARFITLDDIATSHDHANMTEPMLEMLPLAELQARLEKFGISDDSRVVVYYGSDWVSPSTRVIFTLDYAGLGERVSLLDGGMPAWKRAGAALTREVPAARRGRLSPLHARNTVVSAEWVLTQQGKPGVAIVDARSRSMYDGVQTGMGGKKGRVPGALSIPFTALTDDRMQIRSRAELEKIFRAAGVKPGDVVVGYCHIGQQATAMLFAARLLGHDVRLYDGSFEDWARRNYPIENPSGR